MMNNVTHIVTKVRQAPWRVQRQWVGLFLLALVLMAMIAGVGLTVSNRATMAGREAIALRSAITHNQQVNADLQSALASLTSISAMQTRAAELGFEPASMDDISYISIPGYSLPSHADLTIPESQHEVTPILLPDYTESWLDLFLNRRFPTGSTGGQQ